MGTQEGGHREAATAAVAKRAYGVAGNEYTRAGRRVLADPRPDLDPFGADEKGWVGVGLSRLATAGICYRVEGSTERATHRAVEGIAVARDLATCLDHQVQHACLSEFVADFRVIGGLDGVESAYEAAESAYRAADDSVESPQTWAATPLFEAAAAPIKQVARGFANGEIAIAWEDLHGDDPSRPGAFLAARAVYKRQRFPGLLERAIEDGTLAAPRGTTEYDTDHHRCPACGSTDVNWTADSTLCLRCSRPTEPQ